MPELFLSASVPVAGQGHYHETADPFLIQFAVRELVTAIIKDYTLIWGGHPAITPMIWAICKDLDVEYSKAVVLYQSSYFDDQFPEENRRFRNTIYVPKVEGDREASLYRMRTEMLSRSDLKVAVFIGGMQGIEEEFRMFEQLHPKAPVLILGAPGGAARVLVQRLGRHEWLSAWSVDFVRIFREELPRADSY